MPFCEVGRGRLRHLRAAAALRWSDISGDRAYTCKDVGGWVRLEVIMLGGFDVERATARDPPDRTVVSCRFTRKTVVS
jgi:hypothetical protein